MKSIETNSKRPQWSSNFNFILSAIGAAVGLGNIWRFPYIMGKYGGAVFLLTYLILILTICFIPLSAELFLGKETHKENVGAFHSINPKFETFGWLAVITPVIVSSYYFVVGGWILNYIYQNIINNQVSDYIAYFAQFSANPISPYLFSLAFLAIVCFFVAKGVHHGIELANKFMMPLFTIALIILVGMSLSLPNAKEGVIFMFKPDLSKATIEMVLAALGQAFFTLSIGMGAHAVYGSYMRKEDNIAKSTRTIIISDTIYAILAGIMIFPAVFAFNMNPDSGASLVFITIPQIFAKIPYGNIVGILFFALLLFAALTSAIGMIESPTAALIEKFKFSRLKSSLILFVTLGLLMIPTSLSFGLLSKYQLFGKTYFDFLDFITSNIMLPLNSCFACICVGWFMKDKYSKLISNKIGVKIFEYSTKFVLPLVTIILVIVGIR